MATVRVIAFTRFIGVPEELAAKGIREDQDQGSELARLVECAGRCCYDSYGGAKTRGSAAYHQHILEVAHGSTLEHATITFFITGVSRGLCYDEQTEVLTKAGWKLFRDCDIATDEFLTLNSKTETLEYQAAVARTDEPWNGRMYCVQSSMVDLLVTPNHRMYVRKHDTQAARRHEEPWQFLEAQNIFGKRVQYRKSAPVLFDSGSQAEETLTLPDVQGPFGPRGSIRTVVGPKYPLLPFMRFLGYWVAEGHLDRQKGGSYCVALVQKEGPTLTHIVETLRKMGHSPNVRPIGHDCFRVRIFSLPLYLYLATLGKAHEKHVPIELKNVSPSALVEFWRAHLEGDGTISEKSGHCQAYTSSSRLADDLQEIALKIGLSAKKIPVPARERGVIRPGSPPVGLCRHSWIVSYAQASSQMPMVNNNGYKHDRWVDYRGMVHCVTVPNGLLYVRRNGIPVWCGNTHELVRHRAGVAISQRSTRYVSEDESPWIMHPLLEMGLEAAALADSEDIDHWCVNAAIDEAIAAGRKAYERAAYFVEEYLKRKGVDALTARKQARGAARGYLGNSLETELCWTLNLRALRHFLESRASEHADAEIRLLANRIYYAALEVCPEYLSDYERVPCPDGVGFGLVTKHRKV